MPASTILTFWAVTAVILTQCFLTGRIVVNFWHWRCHWHAPWKCGDLCHKWNAWWLLLQCAKAQGLHSVSFSLAPSEEDLNSPLLTDHSKSMESFSFSKRIYFPSCRDVPSHKIPPQTMGESGLPCNCALTEKLTSVRIKH